MRHKDLLCRCDSCVSGMKSTLTKAWEEASDQYHASIVAGNASPELSWRSHVLYKMRSAYYLYADTFLEDIK